MPNWPVDPAVREARKQRLQAITAYLDERGIQRKWLAQRLGITRQRLSHYFHGYNEAPPQFESIAWDVLRNPNKPPPSTSRLPSAKPGPKPRRDASSTKGATHDRQHRTDRRHRARPPPAP